MEKMAFTYEYDFGDSWLHQIEVEEIKQPEAKFRHSVCLEGTCACPPEDIGSVWPGSKISRGRTCSSLPTERRCPPSDRSVF